MVLGCHLERHATTPGGETYRVAIDRRGLWLGNGRLGFITLPVGWILHRWRWPGQWWLTVSRPPRRREYLQWRLTNLWWFGPYDEQTARQEQVRLVSQIQLGAWADGHPTGPPP